MESGLSSSQAQSLLTKYGPNEIPEKDVIPVVKLLRNLISPIGIMLILASGLSFFQGKMFDGYFILALLAVNVGVTFWQEAKADNAIQKLNEKLSSEVTVLRDGRWVKVDSRVVVPGDIVKLTSGEVIPADANVITANNASVNESMLTGESLPKEKKEGDVVYSGSFLVSGVMSLKITATGAATYFGKTLSSVDRVRKKSILEKDIMRIATFLSILSIVAIVFLTVFFVLRKNPVNEILQLDLTLLIAGIPVSLPTVMTLIIEFGVIAMAKKNVIIRRLSSLEDLSNVNYLLTDKTGTITQNKIEVSQAVSYGKFKEEDAVRYAYIVASGDDDNAVNLAIIKKAETERIDKDSFKVVSFEAFDVDKKRSFAEIIENDKNIKIYIGAPQTIIELCKESPAVERQFNEDVESLAKRGFKSLAVCVDGRLAGLLGFSDTLRPEAKSVIEYLRANGIDVSVVTGDNRAITAEIIKGAGIPGKIITKDEIEKIGLDKFTKDTFSSTAAFAEVLPGDKLDLVRIAKKYYVVASNGDGVNDLPAVKEANVGIAVKNAVDALKASADIVLLSNGISVIKDAIIEGRKIFNRINTYAMYRISESQRLIVTATVLGIIYKAYPLTPLQLIILALLNDIPIISLASDKVKLTVRPAKIKVKNRFISSSFYGLAGVVNSLILFFVMVDFLHLPWTMIQTIFFLKLTVSGHMLIYVAHTKEKWYEFLPSKEVIWATSITQIVASTFALTGLFMSSPISIYWVIFVWVWSFIWMQITDFTKKLRWYEEEKK